ncbi:serine hydrolase [Actinocatenispora sera]|uniref:Serine hydrolase n=1 Tax=Actinocatenispora sera TaxID=390989 RepID=A0A810L5C8_9ACTN|nr:serine hydrolase [Actinocatenispora sera]BCJ29318.1 serine hydrolase [Actinocatenispora sera]
MTARPAPADGLAATYARCTGAAGGRWHSYLTVFGETVLDADPDAVVVAASVQKVAIAAAALAAVDRRELALTDTVELTAELVAGGTGTLHLQAAFGDRLTVAHLVVALVNGSDNTAVRLLGRLLPGPRINDFLAAQGFRHTRVQPLPADERHFFLGTTTARETHELLRRLATGALLSPAGTDTVLRAMRWAQPGYCDGVRRYLSSAQRRRAAVKHGADEDRRHEVGIVFDLDGAPAATFAFLADGLSDPDDYGGTHPAVRAHAALGRALLDAVGG